MATPAWYSEHRAIGAPKRSADIHDACPMSAIATYGRVRPMSAVGRSKSRSAHSPADTEVCYLFCRKHER